MAREFVQRFTDYNVKAIAPYVIDSRTVLDDDAGASSSYKVYDPSVDEVIAVDEASSQTVLSVTNAGLFSIGQTVEITVNDDTFHQTDLTDVDPEAGTVTVDFGLDGGGADAGNRIRVILGIEVAMNEFGDADINKRDWGYKETLASTHDAHKDPRSKTGFDVDVEISFDGGSGMKVLAVHCLTIREDDCEQ